MRTPMLLALLVLGTMALGSGCYRPYYYGPRPVYVAPRHPGAYYTGVALAHAGDVALHSAYHQSHPGAAVAATVVGAGLHAAAAGTMVHAYGRAPSSRYGTYRYAPPPRTYRYNRYSR